MGLTQAEFNRLVVEHGDVLYRMAYRLMGNAHDAEDVVQDTFRSVWKSRERFEHGRGDRAWLTSILRRRSADRWRKSDFREQTLGDDLPEPIDRPTTANTDDYDDEMQRALGQLHDDLRETLLLVVVGELTHQETADLLDVPLGTVLSRVSRARRQLREHLQATVKPAT